MIIFYTYTNIASDLLPTSWGDSLLYRAEIIVIH